jgi:hypothetical protein
MALMRAAPEPSLSQLVGDQLERLLLAGLCNGYAVTRRAMRRLLACSLAGTQVLLLIVMIGCSIVNVVKGTTCESTSCCASNGRVVGQT